MSFKSKFKANRSAVIGVVLVTLIGAFLLKSPAGEPLMGLSFDLPFLFEPKAPLDAVIIIKMDEQAYREMKQIYGQPWDRGLHADLLRRFKADGARMVVFDVFLADPGPTNKDEVFIGAIRDFKNVVLAAVPKPFSQPGYTLPPGYKLRDPIPPAEIFLEAVGNQWGIDGIYRDKFDSYIRQHWPEPAEHQSLPWAAAKLFGAPITRDPARRLNDRWIRFYGPYGSLPSLSYSDVKDQAPGFFTNKVVFVGGKPSTEFTSGAADEFPTPFARWSGPTAGVEIIATEFLNLINNDWLNRISLPAELGLIVIAGIVFGAGFTLFRPVPGVAVALVSAIAITACGIVVFWHLRIWFDWALIAWVQIPLAWASSAVIYSRQLFREKETWKRQAETAMFVKNLPAPLKPSVMPQLTPGDRGTILAGVSIPNFELLKCIGEGSYGKVWLARSLTGGYRAIKIIYRKNSDERPFEREFEGVRNFAEISRTHPGWVSILHVGRDEGAGHFYYVMEPADDMVLGQQIDPEHYHPKTLSDLWIEKGSLPLNDCVGLGIALADALEALHQRGLIHRDVKPSNVIFVNDVPKLADIGLVAQIDGSKTGVGTPDYMPPHSEELGTVSADVFSLGRVLYQIATGYRPDRYPSLPTSLDKRDDVRDLMLLLEIINHACADRAKRYPSAAELRDDLAKLQSALRVSNANQVS